MTTDPRASETAEPEAPGAVQPPAHEPHVVEPNGASTLQPAAPDLNDELVAEPDAGSPSDDGTGPDAGSPPEAAPAKLDLEALIAKAERADEYLGLAQRTKADFENYRKRSIRDAAAAQERGVVKLARELLPAVDNLDRALSAAQAAAVAAGEGDEVHAQLVSGISLVHADVISAFARAGIEPFSPEGEPFDPQWHEAVAQQPFESAQPGTVVEVYQRGYKLGDTVLRPARVLVAA